jgi:hypothetical protein
VRARDADVRGGKRNDVSSLVVVAVVVVCLSPFVVDATTNLPPSLSSSLSLSL